MTEPLPAECANCGAPLLGAFCHGCGQRVPPPQLTVRHFLGEAVEEVFNVDGKIVRTVRLLATRPGLLTRELLAGRRARYVSPLRLYLTFSVLFFALTAVVPGGQEKFVRDDQPAEASASPRTVEEEAAQEHLLAAMRANLPRSAFVLMPLFAVLTWLFYRRQQRLYVPHLYHALHFHAFVFLILSLGMPFEPAGKVGKGISDLLALWIVPYFYIGLRRVFGGSRLVTFVKGTSIAVLYFALIAVTMAAMIFLTLRTLGLSDGPAKVETSLSQGVPTATPAQPDVGPTPSPRP